MYKYEGLNKTGHFDLVTHQYCPRHSVIRETGNDKELQFEYKEDT